MVKLLTKKVTTYCAQCRRAGEKLLLKGDKCLTAKCPFAKRSYPPGQHGPNQKHVKMSGYGKQLREKQKAKIIYGLIERQFANYVAEASKKTGDTSKYLLNYLESRLDNVVFRMGFGKSRANARQMVRHGLMTVNGKKVDIPSFRVRIGDVVSLSDIAKKKKGYTDLSERMAKVEVPAWAAVDPKTVSGKVLNAPAVEKPNFNAKSIIEFYSR